MSTVKDMGNKESINRAQMKNSAGEMNSIRDGDLKQTSFVHGNDSYKPSFPRIQNSIPNSTTPTKGHQPSSQNNQKNTEETLTQSSADRLSTASSDVIQGVTAQVREDLMPKYANLQQPMFNPSGYNSALFSGQMIPPMLVQQPVQLPTAVPGMFQTGFMYQTLPPGAAKQSNSYFFPPFTKGSLIMLATGNLKPIEDLKTTDFIESASVSKQLCLETSTVVKIQDLPNNNMSLIGFAVDNCDNEVMVEKPSDHPFFIYEQGWASCKPNKTLSYYGLPCQQLKIGDICVFLSNKQDIRSDRTTDCQPRGAVEEKERPVRTNQQHSGSNLLLQNSETPTSSSHKARGNVDSGISDNLTAKAQSKSTIKKENEESHRFEQPGGKKAKLEAPSKNTDIVKG